MWNEFMEWVDEWDNPMPISDEDEDEDEDEDDDEEPASDKAMGLIVVAAVLPIMALGYLASKTIIKRINKRKEKDESETHATTKRLRANIKNHQQEIAESLPGNGDNRENS